MCLFDSQILFCKRTGSVGVSAIKHYLKRLWLVDIATILSKTLKIHFLFMSAIAHNWSFFTKFNLNKHFGPYRGYHSTLNESTCYWKHLGEKRFWIWLNVRFSMPFQSRAWSVAWPRFRDLGGTGGGGGGLADGGWRLVGGGWRIEIRGWKMRMIKWG